MGSATGGFPQILPGVAPGVRLVRCNVVGPPLPRIPDVTPGPHAFLACQLSAFADPLADYMLRKL